MSTPADTPAPTETTTATPDPSSANIRNSTSAPADLSGFSACSEGVRCASGPVECFGGSFRAGKGIFMGEADYSSCTCPNGGVPICATSDPTPSLSTSRPTPKPTQSPTTAPTPMSEPAPVVLGICRDGMTLQSGEGCTYAGGGTPRANVVLSVTRDGAICREGGPAKQVVGGITLNVDNLRLCHSDGFEVDDAFQSEIVATANADGSWTFYESRQSAQRSLRPTPEPTATPTPTPDNVFEAGETLPNSPAEFSDWRRFGGGAQAQSDSGGFVILMDNGGYGWTYDAVYTCIDPAGCRIENGRVTDGAVRRTEPTATPTPEPTPIPATPSPMPTDTPTNTPTPQGNVVTGEITECVAIENFSGFYDVRISGIVYANRAVKGVTVYHTKPETSGVGIHRITIPDPFWNRDSIGSLSAGESESFTIGTKINLGIGYEPDNSICTAYLDWTE